MPLQGSQNPLLRGRDVVDDVEVNWGLIAVGVLTPAGGVPDGDLNRGRSTCPLGGENQTVVSVTPIST